MIKRLLMLLLALQAATALALAYGLYYWWRPAWRAALNAPATALTYLALGAGAVLLLRLLISANNFLLSHSARSAAPAEFALTPARALRLFAHEFHSSMLTSSYYMLQPIGMRLFPQAQQQGLQGRAPTLPVLLLHGYGCNSGYWQPMSALLAEAGISHYGIDLEPPNAAIDDYVPQVQAAIELLCRHTGAAQVVLLAHSMGGLVARAWLRRHGSARVARVITLGTPHAGTALAQFGIGSNAAQMRRGSEWLASLAEDEAQSDANLQRTLFCSIYSVHDNIVAPQDSSHLPGARNLVFGAVGHVALGRHPSILRCALDEIRAASAAVAAGTAGTMP